MDGAEKAAAEVKGQVGGTGAGVPADMRIEEGEVLGGEVLTVEVGLVPGEVFHLVEEGAVEVQAGGEAVHRVAGADPPIR